MHERKEPKRHRMLTRQVRLSTDRAGVLDIEQLLGLIDGAYGEYDQAAKINHRAMMVAARELTGLNETLSEARDAAEAASRAKSLFLANISHEIRTPLNAILGMAQASGRDEGSEEATSRLDIMREASRALVAVIDDILDISLVEAGTLEVNVAPMDLPAVVRRAVHRTAEKCAEKGVAFSLHIDAEVHGEWVGDASHLERTLSILTNNAIKFTERGVVAVFVRLAGGSIAFEVSDTGTGISEDKLSKIFGPFIQVDASASRRAGGLGLGLAIAQRRVAAMGGELRVTSHLNQGSVFRFSLGLERCTRLISNPGKPDATVGPLRILAAEDNLANQLVLKALWQPFHVELTVVENGAKAVEAWKDRPFDLVLMDIQMPVMNGLEATLEIRRLERIAQSVHVPIVAVTANVMSHQLSSYHAAGMNGWVAKPIELPALLSAVETAMQADLASTEALAAQECAA